MFLNGIGSGFVHDVHQTHIMTDCLKPDLFEENPADIRKTNPDLPVPADHADTGNDIVSASGHAQKHLFRICAAGRFSEDIVIQFDNGVGADGKSIGKHFGSRICLEFRIGNGNSPEIDSLFQLFHIRHENTERNAERFQQLASAR